MSVRIFPQRTTLVMAHPDDEVLWASSVLSSLERIVLCFEEVPSRSGLSMGRARSMAEYPLPTLTRIQLVESEVFGCADWPAPVATPAGLQVKRGSRAMPGYSASRYRGNHKALLGALRPLLDGSTCVLTHSPWGEYGHEEHVQVFRAVADLQLELGFELWVPGYVSEKSFALMLRHVPHLDASCVSLPTDVDVAEEIRALYFRHGCWTWFDDYVWPERDHFYRWKGPGEAGSRLAPGSLVHLNFLWTGWHASRPESASRRWLKRTRQWLPF